MNKTFAKGDKVRAIDPVEHEEFPFCYPPVGTLGTFVGYDLDGDCEVIWAEGSVSENTGWWCAEHQIERVTE